MSDKKFLVIILAGWSCVGKSTIAKKLADIISFDLIDVYEVYHNIAVLKGYKRSRHWLYKVGSRVFVNETTFKIVDYIKSFNESKGVIIDASFGARMNFILRRGLLNTNISKIAVLCGKDIRLNRMMNRIIVPFNEAQKELRFRDNFLRAAVNVKYIMDKADFKVSNETDADSSVREIIKYLEENGIIKSELTNYY